MSDSAGLELHRQFGACLGRLATADTAACLQATGYVLSWARAAGHSAIDLRQWAGKAVPEVPEQRLPELDAWREQLRMSGVVSNEQASALPLVLSGDLLCLWRYYQAETGFAAAISKRCREALPIPEASLTLLRQLFPPSEQVDAQAIAVLAALRQRFCCITGGPGTGKTTTVLRLLAVLLAGAPHLRIALAAPTGKAAQRLTSSIRSQLQRLPEALAEAIPAEVQTLHRLLGFMPSRDRFRHDPENPLAIDVLVIDEASMVDALLMQQAVLALPASARLILLGDAEQLPAVDAGAILAELAQQRGAISTAFATLIQEQRGHRLPMDASAPPLRDCLVHLHTNYRFASQPGIAGLARAIVAGDAEAADTVLHAASDVHHHTHDSMDAVIDAYRDHVECVLDAAGPAEALERLSQAILLLGPRRGPRGVDRINHRIALHLLGDGRIDDTERYRGRPIIIRNNDYRLQLANGDIGVLWPDASGRMQAWFATADGELRALPPARLPPHQSAWAITVHQSQGSEYPRVHVLLPPPEHPLLDRTWLYTAVTRARQVVHLHGERSCVHAAIGRAPFRRSALGLLLADGP